VSTRLAIVGASVRAAAQSALRAGFEVVGADLFADADLDGVCPITKIEDYPYGFADWLAEQDVDAWMYTGALENYPELVDQMAAIKPLWGVSGEALRRCRDPLFLQEVFNEERIPFPETRRIGEADWANRVWLAKSYRHSNGVGVLPMRSEGEVAHATLVADYAQAFVDGDGYSVIYAVGVEGSTVIGATWQWTRYTTAADLEVGYAGSIGPLLLERQCRALIEHVGQVLSDRFSLRGLVGVDFVGARDSWYVVEINPRYTASVEVHDRVSEQSAVAVHGATCRGMDFKYSPPALNTQVAKLVLYAQQSLTIDACQHAWLRGPVPTGDVADIPRPGDKIAEGHPICTLLVEGPGDLVENWMEEHVQAVERCLYDRNS
jgi:predicted ATP-grasp superfamily ATP-dependent carboligase